MRPYSNEMKEDANRIYPFAFASFILNNFPLNSIDSFRLWGVSLNKENVSLIVSLLAVVLIVQMLSFSASSLLNLFLIESKASRLEEKVAGEKPKQHTGKNFYERHFGPVQLFHRTVFYLQLALPTGLSILCISQSVEEIKETFMHLNF